MTGGASEGVGRRAFLTGTGAVAAGALGVRAWCAGDEFGQRSSVFVGREYFTLFPSWRLSVPSWTNAFGWPALPPNPH